jgi:hypothetical protein
MSKKAKLVPLSFRTSQTNLDYLESIAMINNRSLSQLVHLGLCYVIEYHQKARTGNQTGLEVLQLLGPAAAPSNSSTNSRLLCGTASTTEGQAK